jgi:hypothetical protein
MSKVRTYVVRNVRVEEFEIDAINRFEAQEKFFNNEHYNYTSDGYVVFVESSKDEVRCGKLLSDLQDSMHERLWRILRGRKESA